ncbi:MmpS family transport accessory protein [Actinoplanes sp. NPDC026623]|uniref:MmpS family transport accessory protein n=1 Tax=Actinoplanes sp. NPDC026623 TaxID=3155610 RepID=UPI0033CC89DA
MNEIESARRPRTALWIATAASAVLVTAAVVFLLVRDGGPHKVSFEVTSSGEKVSSITYGSGDRQLGRDIGTAATTPWSKSHKLTDTSGDLWLRANSPAGGAITCTIWVDDKVAAESTGLSGTECTIAFDDALDK